VELLEKLKIELSITADSEDSLLSLLIEKATQKVVNTAYPFGYTEVQKDKAMLMYEHVVLDVAIYLYSKRGAYGQKSHNENGTNRTNERAGIPQSYLAEIVPNVGTF